MGEYAPTLKELSTSVQMAFKETQQQFQLSFVPDQQHLPQNSWCPTGKLSTDQFSFGCEAVPRKSKRFLLFLFEAGISPLPTAKFLSLFLVIKRLLSLPVLPCELLLAILVSAGSFSPSANFFPKTLTTTSSF